MATRPNIKEGVLHPFQGDVFHLAPIPLLYTIVQEPNLDEIHADIVRTASRHFAPNVLDVPDERHLADMGSVPEFPGDTWKEIHGPAVGAWHRVPTNNFLNLEADCVRWLRRLLTKKHAELVAAVGEEEYKGTRFLESWIQFYRNGDYKVLHNHQRYDYPYFEDMWVGAYYLTDGDPDYDKKYSGLLSFSVREENYYIRPKPGLLVIWPYDILHQVHPFYGGSERIVINFHLRNDED